MIADTITAIKKAEHERIWLEPAGAPDRCWCQDNQWGDDGVEYVRVSNLESLQRENEELKRRLFPYADTTEISGISWDGKYLIGDKASIKDFLEMQNRGLQIDVYKRAYDENLAALQARADSLDAKLVLLREALEPFADLAPSYDPPEDDDDHKCWHAESTPTLGDLRRARTALSSTGDTHAN